MATETEEVILDIKIDGNSILKDIERIESALISNKEAQLELNKAYKAGTITQQEYVKEIVRLQANHKTEVEQKKTLIKLTDAENNSINALTERNKQLKKERNNLDTTTDAGIKKLNQLNAAIDKNDKAIQKNVSLFEKQKINIGNYASALDAVLPGSEKFVGSITGLTSSLGGTIGAIQKTGLSLQTLNAVPVVALIGSLVSVFNLLKVTMEDNIKDLDLTYNHFQNISKAVEYVTKETNNYIDSLKAENELLSVLGGKDAEILENERKQQLAAIANQKEKINLVKEELKVLLDKRPFDQRSAEDLRKQVSLALLLKDQGKTQEEFLKSKKEELETEQKILITLQNQNTVLGVKATNQRVDTAAEAQKKADADFRKALDERIKFLQAQNESEAVERKRQIQDAADIDATDFTNHEALQKEAHDNTIQRLSDEAFAFLGFEKQKQEAISQTTKIKLTEDQAQLQSAQIVFNSLANLADQGSAAQKVLALTAIGIDTAKALTGGIAAAQDVPYPGNLIAMASVVATILANIASAKQYLDFAEGGYTGPGHKYQIAGNVHAGEVVWSQKDVALSGGPSAVDRMRPTYPRRSYTYGYADGGLVTSAAVTETNQAVITANAIKSLPAPVVGVVEITRVQKRVAVKEKVSRL